MADDDDRYLIPDDRIIHEEEPTVVKERAVPLDEPPYAVPADATFVLTREPSRVANPTWQYGGPPHQNPFPLQFPADHVNFSMSGEIRRRGAIRLMELRRGADFGSRRLVAGLTAAGSVRGTLRTDRIHFLEVSYYLGSGPSLGLFHLRWFRSELDLIPPFPPGHPPGSPIPPMVHQVSYDFGFQDRPGTSGAYDQAEAWLSFRT